MFSKAKIFQMRTLETIIIQIQMILFLFILFLTFKATKKIFKIILIHNNFSKILLPKLSLSMIYKKITLNN
jgi:hypothetical protein